MDCRGVGVVLYGAARCSSACFRMRHQGRPNRSGAELVGHFVRLGRAVLGLVKWCGAKGRADCGKKRSALHRPPQCAASVCAARCISHRTAVHIPVQCRTSGMGVAVKMKWGVLLDPQGRSFSPVQPCSGIQDSLLMIKAKHSSCPHVTHPQMWRCTVGNPGIGIPDKGEAKWWGLMRA